MMLSSENGSDWTLHERINVSAVTQVLWNGTQYCAIGYTGTVFTSKDLQTWQIQSSGTEMNLREAVWYGSQYVVAGDSGVVLTSDDGVSWAQRASGTDRNLTALAHSGHIFVAVGYKGTILSSPDGINWSIRTGSDTLTDYTDIIWNGNAFIAFGSYYKPSSVGEFFPSSITSTDGITWTTNEHAPHTFVPYKVVWGENRYVGIACRNPGILLSSSDGKNWVSRDTVETDYWRVVAWGNNIFMAADRYGTIQSSPDGESWTRLSPDTPWELTSLTYENSRFIAVARHSIYTSSPPVTINHSSHEEASNLLQLKIAGTSAEYRLSSFFPVTVALYNIHGRSLGIVAKVPPKTSLYRCTVPEGLADGAYIVQIKSGNTSYASKLLFIK